MQAELIAFIQQIISVVTARAGSSPTPSGQSGPMLSDRGTGSGGSAEGPAGGGRSIGTDGSSASGRSFDSDSSSLLSGVSEPLEFHPVGGGSINESYRIRARDGRQWFCKINDIRPFPGLFEKERDGLELLAAQRIFRVPSVIACETVGTKQVLILEWIESGVKGDVGGMGSGSGVGQSRSGDGKSFWRLFGEQLAWLHQVSRDQFGLDSDNYMGALPQSNTHSAGWVEFFTQRRLEPQIRLAADKACWGVRRSGNLSVCIRPCRIFSLSMHPLQGFACKVRPAQRSRLFPRLYMGTYGVVISYVIRRGDRS